MCVNRSLKKHQPNPGIYGIKSTLQKYLQQLLTVAYSLMQNYPKLCSLLFSTIPSPRSRNDCVINCCTLSSLAICGREKSEKAHFTVSSDIYYNNRTLHCTSPTRVSSQCRYSTNLKPFGAHLPKLQRLKQIFCRCT